MKAVRIGYPLELIDERRVRGRPFTESATAEFEPPAVGATVKFIEWSVGCAYVTWIIPTQNM